MKKLRPLPKIGEYWVASAKNKLDNTIWLFQIAWITKIDNQPYFLGMKCYWETGKPYIDNEEDSFSQCWWFDSTGNPQGQDRDLFYLDYHDEDWKAN